MKWKVNQHITKIHKYPLAATEQSSRANMAATAKCNDQTMSAYASGKQGGQHKNTKN